MCVFGAGGQRRDLPLSDDIVMGQKRIFSEEPYDEGPNAITGGQEPATWILSQ